MKQNISFRMSPLLVAILLASAALANSPSGQDDPRTTVASFVTDLLGKGAWSPASWRATESAHIAIVRGEDLGTAILRKSDSSIVSFTAPALALGAEARRRDAPTTYLTPAQATDLALGVARALGKSGLRIADVSVTHDTTSPLGDFRQGTARVELVTELGAHVLGSLKPGIVLHFDSATSEVLAYRSIDRFELDESGGGLSVEDAVERARRHALSSWGIRSATVASRREGYCAPLVQLVGSPLAGGELAGGRSLRAVRSIEVRFEEAPGSWIILSLVDGEVLEESSPSDK